MPKHVAKQPDSVSTSIQFVYMIIISNIIFKIPKMLQYKIVSMLNNLGR